MNNTIQKNRQTFVIQALNAGLVKATHAFSIMTGSPVKMNPAVLANLSSEENFSGEKEPGAILYVLTTQLIGEVNGKSYLVMTEKECNALVRALHKNQLPEEDSLKEAFLLELDNIISASVISALSDALKIEIYGDVPQVKKMPSAALRNFISTDKDPKETASMLVTRTLFTLDKIQEVSPLFIWKLSPSILEAVPPSAPSLQNR